MKKGFFLVMLMAVASLAIYAQQAGFTSVTETDLTFKNIHSTLELDYRPFSTGKSPALLSNQKGTYSKDMEVEIASLASKIKTAVDAAVFDPEVKYERPSYNYLNPVNHGVLNFAFERAFMADFLYSFYGGYKLSDEASTTSEQNLLGDFNFLPTGDAAYLNKIIVSVVARELIAEITVDEANRLVEKRVPGEREGYVPLANRSVDEVYQAIMAENENLGFNFFVTQEDVESAGQVLTSLKKVAVPTLDQKIVEAKRQKIISYIRWTFTLERSVEALRILDFVLTFADVPNPEAATVIFARHIAEWRLANSRQWKSLVENLAQQKLPDPQASVKFDLVFGLKTSMYYTSLPTTTFGDTMFKLGVGLNIGESYIYTLGYVGAPASGTDPSAMVSGLSALGVLKTNIRFVDFFELQTDGSFSQAGAITTKFKPNFIIADFLELAPVFYVDIAPAVQVAVGADMMVGKTLGVGIKFNTSTLATTLDATFKF